MPIKKQLKIKPKAKPKATKKPKKNQQRPLITNKNIVNINSSKEKGFQIPFQHYLPPDRFDKAPRQDNTLLLLEHQRKDFDVFKTDLYQAQLNNIKTITDSINTTANNDLQKLKLLAMRYLPNEFNTENTTLSPNIALNKQIDVLDELEQSKKINKSVSKQAKKNDSVSQKEKEYKKVISNSEDFDDRNVFEDIDDENVIEKKQFICPTCNRSDFKSNTGLQNHIRAHAEQAGGGVKIARQAKIKMPKQV